MLRWPRRTLVDTLQDACLADVAARAVEEFVRLAARYGLGELHEDAR